jgi:integrase/recombinase XerD
MQNVMQALYLTRNARGLPASVRRYTEQLFMKHCKLKNLSPQTMRYYAEDLKYFHACVPVRYVDAVSQDAFENFIVSELDAGKKITSLNSRIRGLRVFFKFCAERE